LRKTGQLSKPKHLSYFAILLFVIAGLLAYDIYRRTAAELLWGYRPLLLYLTVWGGWVLARRSRRPRPAAAERHFGLSVLSGVLLALGFPDLLPLPFLLFVAWIPLLLVERDLRTAGARTRALLPYALTSFYLWNVIATFWVTNTAFVAGIFAVVVNSGLMLIPFLLFSYTRRTLPKLGYWPLIAYWFCFEYLHLHWDLTWPWLNLGNAFATTPRLVQWYEYTGTFGGGLWIFLVNFALLQVWDRYRNREALSKAVGSAALLLLLPIGASLIRYHTYDPYQGETVQVSLIQPNLEPHYQKFALPDRQILERFVDLSRAALAAAPADRPTDYLVFPETSFGPLDENRLAQATAIERLRAEFGDRPQLYLLTGLSTYRFLAPDEPRPPIARELPSRNGPPRYYTTANSGAQVRLATGEIQLYHKGKLVPGAENFPFRRIFFFMAPVVKSLGGSVGFERDSVRRVFTGPAQAAPVICYESIFGEYFTEYVRNGAEVAFVMTNDGWWDNTPGHRQHTQYARLRAIETRRAIARAANVGNCAFINQRGDLLSKTEYGEMGFLDGTMHRNDALTFYARRGDLLARVGLLAALFFGLNTVARRLRGE
jgi:apolipoprotein N-acyltransferase